MSSRTKKAEWGWFLFVFYCGLTFLLPVRLLVVPPLELVPLWAHLATVLAGLIFGGLILIVVGRYLDKRQLLGFRKLIPLATGVVWAYFAVALILNIPLRLGFDLLNGLIILGGATLWAFIWANPWRTAAQPGTGDKQ